MEELPDKMGADRLLGSDAGGEVGSVVNSLNKLVQDLDNQNAALLESERLYRTLVEFSSGKLHQLHLLQTLIDAIPSPIFYKDTEGIYLGCNASFETYVGLAKADIVGKTVFDLYPEELASVYFAADNALFRSQGEQCYGAKVSSAEGTLRDVIFYKATFVNSDNRLGGLVGTLLDITERNKIEAALRASEEKFRLFFEESRDAIFVADTNCRLINANQSVLELFGYAREEIL
jgi:PAS domain S-box-containing protein